MPAFVPANAPRLRPLLLRPCARASAPRGDEWNTPARRVRQPPRRLLTFRHPMPVAGAHAVDRRGAVSAWVMERPGDWIGTLLRLPIIAPSKSASPAASRYQEISSRFVWLRVQ